MNALIAIVTISTRAVMRAVYWLVLGITTVFAADIQMQLNDIRWGDIQLGELHIQNSELGQASLSASLPVWQIVIKRLSSPLLTIDQLQLNCQQGSWDLARSSCDSGDWHMNLAGARYQGNFSIQAGGSAAQFNAEYWQLNWSGGQQLSLSFNDAPIMGLDHFWVNHTDWPQISEGLLDGLIKVDLAKTQQTIEWDIQLNQVSFDNAAGDLAAAAVGLVSTGVLQQQIINDSQNWQFSMATQWHSGEVLMGVHYLPAPDKPINFELSGLAERDVNQQALAKLILHQITFDDPGTLQVSAAASWQQPSLTAWQPQAWQINNVQADLAGLTETYLNGVLGKVSLEGMQTSGSIGLTGRFGDVVNNENMPSDLSQGFNLQLQDITLIDQQKRFSVSGLHGLLHWHTSLPKTTDSLLSWEQLQIYRLPFEPAELDFAWGGGAFTLQPRSEIGFLDSGLLLHELRLSRLNSEQPSVSMDAELLPMELTKLTTLMDWPSFGGQLAGRIPGVELSNGIWQLDGQLALDVFDGQVVLSSLSAERPFGVLPNFNVSVWLDRVQLEPLTEAFEIGRITGPVDGQINNLRLLNWQPVQFDAWLRTASKPTVPLRISQRAVDTISSIGGGVGGGLQSTFLRLFEDFGYQKLGFSCRLLNDVCELDGVGDAPQGSGFLLVEGSGLPKLQVVGHNRRVAWQRMLKQLQAATESSGPSLN